MLDWKYSQWPSDFNHSSVWDHLYLVNNIYGFVSCKLKLSLMRESGRWSPCGQFSGSITSVADTSMISSTNGKPSAEVRKVHMKITWFCTALYHCLILSPFSSVYFNTCDHLCRYFKENWYLNVGFRLASHFHLRSGRDQNADKDILQFTIVQKHT